MNFRHDEHVIGRHLIGDAAHDLHVVVVAGNPARFPVVSSERTEDIRFDVGGACRKVLDLVP
jgi:hypothetical protein